MRQHNAMLITGHVSDTAPYWRIAAQYRLISYGVAVLPLLLAIVLAVLYLNRHRTEVSEWRSLIARADELASQGDLHEARRLYLHVDRVAYWLKDWEGLVAAGCRINKLDGANRAHSRALPILFRALATAQVAESRLGLATVAQAFSLLGSTDAAASVRARIQPSWPREIMNSADVTLLEGCSR